MEAHHALFILKNFRELWELAHWPVSSNWCQPLRREARSRSRDGTHNLLLDLATVERAIYGLHDQLVAAVLLMRYWLALDCVEISERLDLSLAAVYRMLTRGRVAVCRAVRPKPHPRPRAP